MSNTSEVSANPSAPSSAQRAAARSANRKVNVRVTAFLFLVMLLCFLDRTNVSYAALHMNSALGFTAAMFGFGVGIMFIGDALFALPSSITAAKVGVHRWIPIAMIAWGACAAGLGAIHDAYAFYLLRFAQGIAAAGIMPSIPMAAAIWFPVSYRARAIAVITSGAAVATIIGAPLGASIMELRGVAGLEGWRWLFIVEGVPVVLIGVLALLWFPAGPKAARWLTHSERNWLLAELRHCGPDDYRNSGSVTGGMKPASYIALASFINFAVAACASVIVFWIPQVANETLGLSIAQIGSVTAPMFAVGAVASYFVSQASDRRRRRYSFIVGCIGIAAVLLGICALVAMPTIIFPLLIVVFIALQCMGGIFLAAASEDLKSTLAGPAFGCLMLMAGCGSFAGNAVFGLIRDRTGSYLGGMLMLCLAATAATLGAAYLGRRRRIAQPSLQRSADLA